MRSSRIQSLHVSPPLSCSGKNYSTPNLPVCAKSTFHRIVVKIEKFLRELLPIADVEVVISRLPEVLRLTNQSTRNTLL